MLSFIFPGLGQAYAGNPRMAAIFAIPVVLLITVPLLLMSLVGETLRNGLLSRPFPVRFVDAPAQPEVNYLLEPRRNAIREEMERLFGADELSGWYLGTERRSP